MATMAAVDLGAQSGRVAVGQFDGTKLSVREAHRFENAAVVRGDKLQWDVERLRGHVFDGLAGCRARHVGRFTRRRLVGRRLRPARRQRRT